MAIWFAYWSNLQGVMAAFAVILAAITLIAFGVWVFQTAASKSKQYSNHDDEIEAARLGKSIWHISLPATILAGVIAALPTAQDLWKARVALVTYELAAPENVQKATDAIERIGHKLECKYLGGCEKKKAEPPKK